MQWSQKFYTYFCAYRQKLSEATFSQHFKKLSLYIGVFCFLLLPSCENYFSQRIEDIYANKRAPVIADALANPKPTPEQEQRILKIDRKGMLPVGVIDNGTDFLHPSLIDQIDHEIKNEKWVGAGTDVMGGDNNAHPTVVNHSLFAFGAKSVDSQGRIVGQTERPIELMHQLNEMFMEKFLERIANEPSLDETYFARLDISNMSVFGAYSLVNFLKNNPFSEEEYNEGIEKEVILSPQKAWEKHLESLKKNEIFAFELNRSRILSRFAKWNAMNEDGLPTFDFEEYTSGISKYSIDSEYGSPEFIKILKSTFSEFDKNSGFSKKIKVFSDFLKKQGAADLQSETRRISDATKKLQEVWYQDFTQYKDTDPFRYFINIAAKELSDDTWLELLQGKTSFEDVQGELKHIILNQFDKIGAIYEVVVNHPKALIKNKVTAKENLENLGEVKKRVEDYLETRDFSEFSRILDQDFLLKPLKDGAEYSQMGSVVNNPYLAREEFSEGYGVRKTEKRVMKLDKNGQKYYETVYVNARASDYLEAVQDSLGGAKSMLRSSNKESHGTHTALSIALKNPKILIHPIRVMTSGKFGSSSYKKKIASRFHGHFSRWIENPAVFQGVVDMLKPFLLSLGEQTDTRKMSPKKVEQVMAEIKTVMKEELLQQVDESSLNMEFFEQILESIAVLGSKKIPFANVSLGSNFEQPPAIPNGDDKDVLLDQSVKFLQFEMYKFLVAEQLQEKAPGTTIFVAAGNDGAWLDAESRSALPAIPQSPYFKDYEPEFGPVPNNKTDQILAVGSLRPNGVNLSSFTNVIIRKGIPFILGVGEAVVSSIQLKDPSGAELEFEKKFPVDLTPMMISEDIPIKDILSAIGDDSLDGVDEERTSMIESKKRLELMTLMTEFNDNSRNALKREFCAHSTNCTIPMNGTSMATPEALGTFVDSLIKEMDSEGIEWSDELYNKKGYQPADLINRALKLATPLDESLRLDAGKILSEKLLEKVPKKTPMIWASNPDCVDLLSFAK